MVYTNYDLGERHTNDTDKSQNKDHRQALYF